LAYQSAQLVLVWAPAQGNIAFVVVGGQISRRKKNPKNKVTQAALILKAPRVGEVKTRLARSMGAERATRIYRALVEHQLAQIPASWRTVIHFAPSDAEAEMHSWLGEKFPLNRPVFVPQPNGDLGSRLISAMDHGFASGADFVFFLGGDCPGLTCSYLEEAEDTLVETDMVIASARDGGYVLLGLRKPMASIFEGISWSSETVFATTLRLASAAGLSFRCLPPLEDVDDLESYERQRMTVRNLAALIMEEQGHSKLPYKI
jgi:rSAM/selenodomain-associated transferase 1